MRYRLVVPLIAAITMVAAGTVAVPAFAAPGASVGGAVRPSAGDGAGWVVTAAVSGTPAQAARVVGRATSSPNGSFAVPVSQNPGRGGVLYLTATAPGPGNRPTFATVLPAGYSGRVVLNERTTVAAGVAMAQFISGAGIAGRAPGVANAASMVPNLVDLATGGLGRVITTSPNGGQTSTLATFTSMSNMLAACVAAPSGCDALRSAATTPGWPAPTDSFRAFASITRNPGNKPLELFTLAKMRPAFGPGVGLPPTSWTLALRFDGGGGLLDGPGNFAIDPEGNLWVNNNYVYNSDRRIPVCASDLLFKFGPDGALVDGSPYRGGGLSGSGFGVTLGPAGNVWATNYGFAAPGCTDQPPHNSVSVFTAQGKPISPSTGITQGKLDWPQGVTFDQKGNLWMANCGSGTVTLYPGGDPTRARTIDAGLKQAFGVVDNGRHVMVTGMETNNVAVFDYDGTLVRPPLTGRFQKPMGIAGDKDGNVWVANSGAVTLPCPERPSTPSTIGSVSLISPDGKPVAGPFYGGGATLPWGIATDGDGNVWVANFGGKRLSHFCGVNARTCPPGKRTGAPISPEITGYAFDGLVRNTGVAVDQSGNVWVANNWDEVPIQSNPGGHEIVAFLGMAPPVQH
ncbi:NHL repeat-containing protein [Gordonia mangrovi]|uniref:NHL repeat-containing protein n=1 Tax=Gordonia mangrovi TaxID=2665643 RepID=UPI001F356FE6|nr:NHL repeat-containing protein [Gordonia mangrovi]UVF76889.1 NHL repeat-containing protein [Gordonia mangrovi]